MRNDNAACALIGGSILLFVLLVIFMPFLVVWALNTLFGLTIAYSLKTWFATLVICAVVSAKNSKTK